MSLADDRRVEHLLIVRLSAMGDVIHTLPAAYGLRRAFPRAMIGWLIEERWAELVCAPGAARRGPRSTQRPVVDWVHTVDLKRWRKSLFSIHTAEQIVRVRNDVRAARYDVTIDLQGAIRSAVLGAWSGAPVVYGAREPRETPAALWYTRQTRLRGAHVIEQNLSIVEAVAGKRMDVPEVEFPRDSRAEEKIEERLRQGGIGEFAILNPGAGWGAKQWPVERYGRVAQALSRWGMQSVVNFGPGEEQLAREAEAASNGAARALQCSISELVALSRRAKLFVGGDTGPLHLAAALKVPVVAIFGPTDPARNGPYGTRSVVLRNAASATTHARTECADEGMLAISVDAVVDAARSFICGTTEAMRG
ncbi:MAG TPA: lipopolysaccharide heptosyltransferase I [Candidatus Binatia bacterium]|nr:lipopolysaccharide heptosyltransferase I [Candidatus Binatia bacterium]